jgi:hypothetical protein
VRYSVLEQRLPPLSNSLLPSEISFSTDSISLYSPDHVIFCISLLVNCWLDKLSTENNISTDKISIFLLKQVMAWISELRGNDQRRVMSMILSRQFGGIFLASALIDTEGSNNSDAESADILERLRCMLSSSQFESMVLQYVTLRDSNSLVGAGLKKNNDLVECKHALDIDLGSRKTDRILNVNEYLGRILGVGVRLLSPHS